MSFLFLFDLPKEYCLTRCAVHLGHCLWSCSQCSMFSEHYRDTQEVPESSCAKLDAPSRPQTDFSPGDMKENCHRNLVGPFRTSWHNQVRLSCSLISSLSSFVVTLLSGLILFKSHHHSSILWACLIHGTTGFIKCMRAIILPLLKLKWLIVLAFLQGHFIHYLKYQMFLRYSWPWSLVIFLTILKEYNELQVIYQLYFHVILF